ncbi:outer membrane protein assembly factor BamB family protein [Bythopirellula goksoeyrii]|uniref:Outer membrane biogenesis protein BamB n=1 Tax=Bythopirellula goksoeyrii TaxID=1400387 RepID=A0A5B9QNA2_9BACT|nr:PQQ-binding-like beta-propeller repeat protein [Bythopirellula goksoeyrii]QEG35601.1 outer membrane biogenesis protein BamB [Bythopirellula goksoeyrii]
MKDLRFDWLALFAPLCALTVFITPVVRANDFESWPTYGGNNAHTGYVPVDLDTRGYRLDWHRDFLLPQTQQPGSPAVIENGRVFVTTRDIGLEAISLDTGTTLWRNQFEFNYRGIGFPSVYEGTVYLNLFGHSSTSGNTPDPALASFDATTGQEHYRVAHEGQSGSGGQPVVSNGGVFMSGGYFGGIDGYDANTGTRLWFKALGLHYNWVPSADENHVYVYNNGNYAGQRGELLVMNPHTGSYTSIPDPQSPTIYDYPETPVLGANNRAYVSRVGAFVAFDLENSRIDWQRDLRISQFAIDEDRLYSVGNQGLIEVSLIDGAELRSWNEEDLLLSGTSFEGYQPFLTNSHVLIMTASETLAINRVSWDIDWRLPYSGRVSFADNRLLISNSSEGVAAFVPIPEPNTFSLLSFAVLATFIYEIRRWSLWHY